MVETFVSVNFSLSWAQITFGNSPQNLQTKILSGWGFCDFCEFVQKFLKSRGHLSTERSTTTETACSEEDEIKEKYLLSRQ